MGWHRTTDSRWHLVYAEMADITRHVNSAETLKNNQAVVTKVGECHRQLLSNYLIDITDAEAIVKGLWESVITVEINLVNREVSPRS